MNWTGPNQGKLRKALLDVHQDLRRLKRFVTDNFVHPLADIGGSSLEDWAEALIEKAVAEDWIDDLYEKFCTFNSKHLRIVQLKKDLQDTAAFIEENVKEPSGRIIGEPNSGNIVARSEADSESGEDPRSTHLVIAVFWQEPSKQKCRVQPKLCYRDMKTRELLQESLLKDDCSIVLKDFPVFLKKLVDFTIEKLSNLFLDPIHPWKLTIELFVPMDLLCSPLAKWCGQDGELLRSRSIVMGCSDRFDPNQTAESANLHNQLKGGWQRFQDRVPDQNSSKLQNLGWLKSDLAHQEDFEAYSGFQCYGDWLKPDSQYLKNWQELVKSGIPLALWMCEGQPQRETIEATFNRLTDCTRFEFLDQIRKIRTEQRKICNYCVGVFYEDPNYVPEIPRTAEKQFFSWPGA